MTISKALFAATCIAALAACGGREENNMDTMDANITATDNLGTDMNLPADMNGMDMNATDLNATDMNADMNAGGNTDATGNTTNTY